MSAHDGRISPLPPHSSEESSERSFNAVTNVSDAKVASSAPTANSNDGTATPKAEESTHLAHGSWWHTHYIFPHIISKPLFVLYIVTGLIIAIYALCYLHATWDPMSHLPNVPVAICNDDVGYQALGDYDPPSQAVAKALTNGGTPVGQSITSGLLNTPALRNRLAWNDLSGQKLTHEDIISLVDHGDYWGVVYIPANFSDNFLTNLRLNVSGTGAPRAAVPLSAEYIFDQGRSLTVSNYVSGVVTASMSALSQQFGMKLLNATESNPNIVKPVFYMSPFSLASGKRHAVLTFGANLVTYIVLLLMWLGAMLSVTGERQGLFPYRNGKETHP
ncbi:uncharacterized protein EV422DRAFT_522996 [Fimicolochytrium jonesii]|uniref:uncharacterized protein n=1 Tax=Fimicolochytrium jonesii TaxID=1396493 RepID=UPI0022FE9018|nr:uncharacterized protein EV422DRAFT_522996 [Fimicolochytrium jonesii]KAI8823005.1 hypothetical protein EV422DRAFT_522996 [Fimicolochytrium jonesii]